VNDSLSGTEVAVAVNVGVAATGLGVDIGVIVEVGDGGMNAIVGGREVKVAVGVGCLY
jgi:hypothetical protein